MDPTTIVLLLTPVVVLQLLLIVLALRNLLQPEQQVRGESKVMWGLIICFVSLIGPMLYFTVGRETE